MKEKTKLIESGPNSKTSLYKWPVVRVGHFVKIPFQFSLQNSGSARVLGYTVYRGFLNRVYGILQLKYGYSVYHFL